MKAIINSLPRFESVITNDRTKFVMQTGTRAFRTTDGTSRRKTHDLELLRATGVLIWQNTNKKEFRHYFETPEEAQEWWNRMVVARSVQAKAAANEMDL